MMSDVSSKPSFFSLESRRTLVCRFFFGVFFFCLGLFGVLWVSFFFFVFFFWCGGVLGSFVLGLVVFLGGCFLNLLLFRVPPGGASLYKAGLFSPFHPSRAVHHCP